MKAAMLADRLIKALYIFQARIRLTIRIRLEYLRFTFRKKFGDPSQRPSCCDLRPESYPEGVTVKDIPELQKVLLQTSTLMLGYSPCYCCTVCGQEWFQEWQQLKQGGYRHLRKLPATSTTPPR